jgi:hypothetical protein
MATKTIKWFTEDLEKFLRSHRKFTKACTYCSLEWPKGYIGLIDGLDMAFRWKRPKTSEGWKYWSDLHYEYKEKRYGKKN